VVVVVVVLQDQTHQDQPQERVVPVVVVTAANVVFRHLRAAMRTPVVVAVGLARQAAAMVATAAQA
jgi:hypothetical protein